MASRIEVKLIEDGKEHPKVRLVFPVTAAKTLSSLVPAAVKKKITADGLDLKLLFSDLDNKEPQIIIEYRTKNKTAIISLIDI